MQEDVASPPIRNAASGETEEVETANQSSGRTELRDDAAAVTSVGKTHRTRVYHTLSSAAPGELG